MFRNVLERRLFSLICLFVGVLVFMASIALAYGCTFASSVLHKQLLLNCLQLPITFYDVTPLGRIVNRFSKDLDSIDVVIPRCLQFWIKSTMHLIGVLFVISFSTPLFLTAAAFLGIFYFLVQVCKVEKSYVSFSLSARILHRAPPPGSKWTKIF